MSKFTQFNLDRALERAISDLGFTEPKRSRMAAAHMRRAARIVEAMHETILEHVEPGLKKNELVGEIQRMQEDMERAQAELAAMEWDAGNDHFPPTSFQISNIHAGDGTVNGIHMETLQGTVNAIEQEPELGQCKFRARNKWLGGNHNCTTITGFYGARQEIAHKQQFELHADEPPLLAGGDEGGVAGRVVGGFGLLEDGVTGDGGGVGHVHLVPVKIAGGAVDQQPAGLVGDLHVGQLPLDRLELGDGPTELLPLAGVAEGGVVAVGRRAHRAPARADVADAGGHGAEGGDEVHAHAGQQNGTDRKQPHVKRQKAQNAL